MNFAEIEQERMTSITALIKERDGYKRALEKACEHICWMDKDTCPLADADNFVKKEACEDCSDFMASLRAKDCWMAWFKEITEEE